MSTVLKGLASILEAMGGLFDLFPQPRSSQRIQRMLRESQRRQQWYHDGEWHEHPLYGERKS